MRLDKALLDLAAEQRSCVAVWQIRELGATPTEICRLRSSPRWELLNKQILLVPGAVLDESCRVSAAVLAAGPGAVLSHGPGTALWGVPGFRLLPAICSQVSGNATRRHKLGYVHDLVVVPERWVTTLKGIRVVRPELAAYQMCGELSPQRAARTFDQFLSRRLLSVGSAKACLDDLARRGRDGTVVYRDILKARGNHYIAPASGLESRVKELGEEVGLNLRRQVNLGNEERFDGRVDFYEDRVKVVFEVESELYHWALSDAEADAIRRKRLEDDGFVVHQIWEEDVWTRPGKVTRMMRAAVRIPKSHSAIHRNV
jgi:very-short-patch-repair endonuclease